MAWVAGVDGCHAGWFVVLKDTPSGETRQRLVEHLADALTLPEKPVGLAVDIPIGLLDHAGRGGRECDTKARSILGQPRARSVFSPPVRSALRYSDYASANKANRASSSGRAGISIQSFSLRRKLLEVDSLMTPDLQESLVKEVHPELCLYELNGHRAMKHSKKKRAGLLERRKLLTEAGFDAVVSETRAYRRTEVGEDDVLDACVACWTAVRILEGDAIYIPAQPSRDKRALRMEMWR